MLREKIADALKAAMKARDPKRVSALRMVLSALKEREIAKRGGEGPSEPDEAEIVSLLGKLVRQREESAALYDRGGRPELAAGEREEIVVIQEFLPRQVNADEMRAAVEAAVAETRASSIKDMGRVMAALKARHAGAMDFGKAGALVKEILTPR